MKKYYAMLDTENLAPLGEYEDFPFDDEIPEVGNYHWIFSEEGLRAFRDEINKVLEEQP